LRMAVETALRDAAGDILLVMPSYEFLRHCTVSTRRALQSAARRFPLIAGLDTGSWLLAQAGLLDGYCATIHWDEVDRFSEEFTQVDVRLDRVVQDRDRITCGGASTAFDLTMALIGQRHGQALRLQVEGLFSGMQSDRPQAMHGPVAQAVQVMRANLEDPLPINVIAQHIGRTQRDLEGRMKVQMGATPQAVYRHLRLTQARRLAKDTMMPVVEIAVRCGYRDASAMTRAFRAEFGTTPQALRRP
ncbi:MAG: GlxA family transcriptional regulator, partial [Planktomarina sp.]